jgi:hypothetical protein
MAVDSPAPPPHPAALLASDLADLQPPSPLARPGLLVLERDAAADELGAFFAPLQPAIDDITAAWNISSSAHSCATEPCPRIALIQWLLTAAAAAAPTHESARAL